MSTLSKKSVQVQGLKRWTDFVEIERYLKMKVNYNSNNNKFTLTETSDKRDEWIGRTYSLKLFEELFNESCTQISPYGRFDLVQRIFWKNTILSCYHFSQVWAIFSHRHSSSKIQTRTIHFSRRREWVRLKWKDTRHVVFLSTQRTLIFLLINPPKSQV